jgi:hypothetical protein
VAEDSTGRPSGRRLRYVPIPPSEGEGRGGSRIPPETLEEESIPLARPSLGAAEQRAVLEVLRSGELSLGPKVGEFEGAFAERVGARAASAVSSVAGGGGEGGG